MNIEDKNKIYNDIHMKNVKNSIFLREEKVKTKWKERQIITY